MDTNLPNSDRTVSIDGPRVPAVLLFDVNETLSNMSPMASRFVDVGAPAHLAATWFASLLRDGFALTAEPVAGSHQKGPPRARSKVQQRGDSQAMLRVPRCCAHVLSGLSGPPGRCQVTY